MHLKMKTCFKFLPLFFCFFFILSGGSCGGSKNVTKQLQPQNEIKPGEQPKDKKPGGFIIPVGVPFKIVVAHNNFDEIYAAKGIVSLDIKVPSLGKSGRLRITAPLVNRNTDDGTYNGTPVDETTVGGWIRVGYVAMPDGTYEPLWLLLFYKFEDVPANAIIGDISMYPYLDIDALLAIGFNEAPSISISLFEEDACVFGDGVTSFGVDSSAIELCYKMSFSSSQSSNAFDKSFAEVELILSSSSGLLNWK